VVPAPARAVARAAEELIGVASSELVPIVVVGATAMAATLAELTAEALELLTLAFGPLGHSMKDEVGAESSLASTAAAPPPRSDVRAFAGSSGVSTGALARSAEYLVAATVPPAPVKIVKNLKNEPEPTDASTRAHMMAVKLVMLMLMRATRRQQRSVAHSAR